MDQKPVGVHQGKASADGESGGKPASHGPLGPVIYTAGILSLVLLIGAATTVVKLNESLSHLATSIVVVALVHLLDRYVFGEATWRELVPLRTAIEHNITAKMQSALSELTVEVSQTVAEKSDTAIEETKLAFDGLVRETHKQTEALSTTITGNVSQGTRHALETLTADVTLTVGKRTDQLLEETKVALNDILDN